MQKHHESILEASGRRPGSHAGELGGLRDLPEAQALLDGRQPGRLAGPGQSPVALGMPQPAGGDGGLKHGNPGAAGNLARARLVAGKPEHACGRSDEAHAGRVTAAGEHRVLGHEAVTGIDRVGADGDRQIDDQLRIEIGADRVARFADLIALVGLQTMHGVAVLGHIDRDAANPKLVRRTKGPDRDLPAIRDQQRFDHRHVRSRTGAILVTAAAASARVRASQTRQPRGVDAADGRYPRRDSAAVAAGRGWRTTAGRTANRSPISAAASARAVPLRVGRWVAIARRRAPRPGR